MRPEAHLPEVPLHKKCGIIKVLEGLPNLLRGFREGFTIKTSIVVEGSS